MKLNEILTGCSRHRSHQPKEPVSLVLLQPIYGTAASVGSVPHRYTAAAVQRYWSSGGALEQLEATPLRLALARINDAIIPYQELIPDPLLDSFSHW